AITNVPRPQVGAAPVPIGTFVNLVGRPPDSSASDARSFVASSEISSVSETEYFAPAFTQEGDSGGPVFPVDQPGLLIGIHEGVFTDGSSSIFTRVDLAANWLENLLAQNPKAPVVAQSGSGGCNGIDYFGQCDGDVLSYCSDGTLQTVDCAGGGGT